MNNTDSELQLDQNKGHGPEKPLLEGDKGMRRDQISCFISNKDRSSFVQGRRTDPLVRFDLIEDETSSSSGSNSVHRQEQTSTPKRNFRVKRHINTDRKMIDWSLLIEKKWIFLGDSNLSRIGEHRIPDLQINSFPGANFRHAEALMKKLINTENVEKVI